ncbi:hypothetical protein ACJRO7_021296 [Eucalyptus globulus]|uniref:AAA+ ATPase domain-containing protein n=1 Tax=Eucalyptus globulus TaxID=34317 RepID=A0ABD3KLX2_EUCGL
MSVHVRKIRRRMEAIAAKGRDFDLREHAKDVQVERGSRRREQSDSSVRKEEIIGRDGAKSAMLKFLLDSAAEERIPVLSICGEGGVGKTALARCLYKDDMVNKHFDLRVWVCVRHLCDLKMVLQRITESATKEGADDIELEQLQNQLMELIRGKRYLLVLDDVMSQSHEQWGRLKSLLMGGAEGSQILITTRLQSVAHSMGTTPPYFLRALSENSSLDLLMRMACKDEEETRDSVIGRQIVKKCGGIPLAIRTIGSILFSMETAAEWLHFEHEIPEVSADFYGIISHLKLSYEHLPSHLKQCFVFCSLFPEDCVIDKLMLTSLWMAQGFIRPTDNVDWDMEDIAHEYFMDLLRRNFFYDCIEDEFGNVTSCKMHGILNTLARIVAENEYSQGIDQTWSLDVERIRHVSWGSTLDLKLGLPTTLLRAKHLRTFIKTDQIETSRCETHMGEKALREFISSFKFLRALDWHNSGIEKLPSSICKLKHLTFLDLSENRGIIRLPDSMTRLRSLQVLKLNMCYNLIALPRDIKKLVDLRQLEISGCSALSQMPHGLGQLTLLHTLTDFLLPGNYSCPKNCCGLGELNKLSSLRGSLRIEVKGEIEDAVAESNATNLKEKDSLVSLVLVFAGKQNLNLRSLEIKGYGGTRFPSWMSHMPKLVNLRLFHCAGCKSLPPLGELTSLKRSEIGDLPIVKYPESDLHTLSSLPNLSTLRIWECPNLEWIPPLLHFKELKPPTFPLEPLQTLDVINLLEIKDDEVGVRIVGIHGTSGIGKTTLAKAVYDRLSSCFDSCSFLARIGETTQNVGGIQFVQTKLICDVLEQDGDVTSFEGGIKIFKDVFCTIKVLIVVDDVEEQSHLDDLVGDQLDLFGPGSRIIVTLENGGILQTCVSRGLARMYEVNEMDTDRALELFCKHALVTNCSIPSYLEIGKHIVKATGQVPLVIELLVLFYIEDLIKPQKENSREILKDCREILKFCYEALDEKQRQIFWDIACFANGVDSRIASYSWPDRDLLPSHHVLMPLAKIGGDNMLWMHKLLKHLSRTIDLEEPKYLGRHSRQYMYVTDLEVINREEGVEEVETLCFDFKNLHRHTFTETDFKSMPNIRFLKLDHASMTGNFANVFPKLRWLRWQGCPRDFEAAECSLTEPVILDLSWSKVTEDWEGWRKIKMEQLKVLNLTYCTDLLTSPTFSSFPNLEMLILERCSRLVHLDPSVGGLKKLFCLNLKSCTELNRLPAELGALKALKELLIDETSVRDIPLGCDSKELETLSASNCLSLSFLPHSIEHLTSLSILSVDNSKIAKLPDGFGKLVNLRCLSLRNCRWIQDLPESIGQLGSSLEELDISRTGVSELPDSFRNLQKLRVLKMDHCFISEFPSFIWHLHSLEEIHASSCRNLEGEIPRDIGELINLRILTLRYSAISSLPLEIKHLSKLETLDVLHCDMLHELPELPSGLVNVHLSPKLKEKVSNL